MSAREILKIVVVACVARVCGAIFRRVGAPVLINSVLVNHASLTFND
ncbi:MAG: hypothetical protein ACYDDO_04670 [Acidiferrobacterales bacterium]